MARRLQSTATHNLLTALISLALQERLEREYNLDLVTTAPTVVYKTLTTDGEELTVNSPGDLPDATKRQNISEPYVRLEMVTPAEYVGNLMELANNRRGEFVEMKYLTGAHALRVVLKCVCAE
jgi:GTP-binding protein LepA